MYEQRLVNVRAFSRRTKGGVVTAIYFLTGVGLWFAVAFLVVYYYAAYVVAKHRRARERNAEIIRSVVVPSRDAHLAEKQRAK